MIAYRTQLVERPRLICIGFKQLRQDASGVIATPAQLQPERDKTVAGEGVARHRNVWSLAAVAQRA